MMQGTKHLNQMLVRHGIEPIPEPSPAGDRVMRRVMRGVFRDVMDKLGGEEAFPPLEYGDDEGEVLEKLRLLGEAMDAAAA